ncbi:MAG: SagB/ThcOx family dehydrogenase [Bacteroidales bacterium]|nr:SagB/ThcOx family dehydrogenase [Bacteroidales bacterium]
MRKIHFILIAALFAVTSCQHSEKGYATNKQEAVVPMELSKFDTIRLETPDTLGGKPLMTALQNRKSDRQFETKNLSLKHLSEVLWAANGINRKNGKRTVPSAMALYPLQTYALLANGIYFYNPQKHQLEPVVEGDFRELAGKQDFVKGAPLNLVFIADYKTYEGEKKVEADKRVWLASLDAGHCTQNVYLYCASEGLKCVVRAGAQETELLKVLKLDDKYQFIVAQTVGY